MATIDIFYININNKVMPWQFPVKEHAEQTVKELEGIEYNPNIDDVEVWSVLSDSIKNQLITVNNGRTTITRTIFGLQWFAGCCWGRIQHQHKDVYVKYIALGKWREVTEQEFEEFSVMLTAPHTLGDE